MSTQAKVLEWLESSGFPLEMRAAAAFRAAAFEVRQSAVYSDPETTKGREVDVLATQPDIFGVINIGWILECKAHKNPWIVLSSDDAYSNFHRVRFFAVTSESAFNYLSENFGKMPAVDNYLRCGSRGGYALRQAFAKENDPAYSAAVSVLKACFDFATRDKGQALEPLYIAFPVIVVSAPLLECSLRDDGSLTLNEVEMSEFLFLAQIPERVSCRIRVVTERALPRLASEAMRISAHLRTSLEAEQERILNGLRG